MAKKKNPEVKSDFISLKEAAKYCDYTQEYLSLRARQGKLKAVKFARNWLTKKGWIEEYIREMEEYERNQRKQIEVKPKLEKETRFVKGILISLSRISFSSKLKPVLALSLILLLLFSSIALSKESLKNVLQDTIFYVQQTPKTINYVLKESKKSLASSLDSLNQSFINLAEVIKTTDYEDLKEPIPLFKEYFQWSVTNLKSLFVQKPKDLGRNILDYGNRISLKIVQGFKHQALTFRKGGGRFVKQIKEGILEFGQAIKDLTLYIYNLALRTPDILVRRVTESIPTLVKKIVDFGSYTSNIFKKGWQNLVLKFQAGREELKNFITRLFKPRIVKEKPPEKEIVVEVSKEEFEKLKQEIETIKREGLPAKEITKEVEVSRITKVEPIKEITKEIKVLDDESLKRIRIALSQQETDVEKLKLAASFGYVNINFPPILSLSGATTITTLGTITAGTWNGDVITTTYGGTGADLSAGAQGGLVYMGASSIMGISAAGTSGYALISGGTGVPTWTSTPSWSTITLSTSVTSPLYTGSGAVTLSSGGTSALTLDSDSGTVRVSAGDTLQADTITDGTATLSGGALTGLTTPLTVAQGGTDVATFGDTNTILYTTTADNLSSIATANNGVLVTGATGIPSIATDIPTAVTIGGAYIYRVGGTDVSNADVANDLTISGGTIDNSIIGGTTAAAGTFTNIGLDDTTNQIVLDADAAVNKGTITMDALTGAQTWTFPDSTGSILLKEQVDTEGEFDALLFDVLTGNEPITLSGDVTGSGATAITTTIGSDKILEGMLKAVDAAIDEDILTYEFATGDFEWHTGAELGIGTATSITDNLIIAADFANEDWGDVAITTNVAYVQDLTISGETQGDVLYFNGSNWVRLAKDTGKYLKSGASAVSWDTPAGAGDITDVGDCSSGDCFTADGTGNTLYFEGAAADAFETILTSADITVSDKTFTFPDDEIADNDLIVGTGAGTFGYTVIPDCEDPSHLNYDVTAGTFSCGTTDDDVPEAGDYTALTGGTGIGHAVTGTLTFDATELGTLTWGDGTLASVTHTYSLSGATDPVWTIGDNSMDLTTGVLKVGGTAVLTGNETITLSGDVTGSGATAITTAIAADIITEADLDVITDTAVDEDILTYESGAGGDFEWHSGAELGIGTATSITDGLIVKADFAASTDFGEISTDASKNWTIDAGVVVVGDLASANFGDWTCNGTSCTLNTSYLPLAGGTLTGALTIAPTTTGTFLDFALETEWTTGTLINADFASPTTLSGAVTGINLDLSGNVTATGQSVTGQTIALPAVTNTGAGTYNYKGLSVTGGALIQNTAAGTDNWTGLDITMPDITQTTGTVTSTGLKITGGTVTSGTSYGLIIDSNAGNVGIGTTSPISKLDVIDSSLTPLLTLGSANTASWSLKGGDGTGWADAEYLKVYSLTTYNGKLYAGLGDSTSQAELWEYNGSSWTKIGGDDIGWATGYEMVHSLTTYNGKLYAGLGRSTGQAELWEYNGSSWTKIGGDGTGWADATYEIVWSLTTYNGKLYAGLSDSIGDAEVWEYNGSSWTKIGGDGTGWAAAYRVYSLTTYNGKLYAGLGYSAGDAEVWEYNGSSWTKIGGDGTGWGAGYEGVHSLTTYNGKLYAGLGYSTAGEAEVWEYNGSSWTKIGGDGTGWADTTYERVWSLTTYNGKLYAGLGDGTGDAELWEYNGSSWTTLARHGVGLSLGDYLFLDRNGYVGIGKKEPESELDIRGDIRVSDSLLVTSGGNVGIGTTSPSEKLTVEGGNIKVQGEEPLFEGFEGETFPPTNWTTGDDPNWVRDTATKYAGIASAASGTITDNQSTWLDRDYTFSEVGVISFYWKVSSEENYDFLVFCLDNDSCTRSSGYHTRISGEVAWTKVNIYVSAGAHSFRWLYGKDISTPGGSDKGWVDNVTFEIKGNVYIANSVGIGTTTPQGKLDIRGDLLIPAPDIELECDGSTSTNKGTCDSHTDGTALVGTQTADNLCTDSLTSPTIIFLHTGTKTTQCDTTDGIVTNLLGTAAASTAYTNVSVNWTFVDSGATPDAYDDGEDLYIDEAPATKYFVSGGSNFIVDPINGRVGIGTTTPSQELEVYGNIRLLQKGIACSTISWDDNATQITACGNIMHFSVEDGTAMAIYGDNVGIGKIYPNVKLQIDDETTTASAILFQIESDVTVADTIKFKFEAEGEGLADIAWNTFSPYLSMTFVKEGLSKEDFKLGEIVIETGEGAVQSTQPYDQRLLGVVVPKEGFISTPQKLKQAIMQEGKTTEDFNVIPVAHLGKVKTKVCLEAGPIEVGDCLTSSSKPGIAMKATQPGIILGRALELFDGSQGETGKVEAFVNLGWYGGSLDSTGSFEISEDNTLTNNEQSLLDGFVQKVKQALADLGIFIENGIVRIKELVVEKLKIGSQEEPTGITLYDEETGEPYCVKMKGGELISLPGECDSVSINPELPQTGGGAGAGDNISESQPETSEDQSEEESVPEEPPAEEQPTEELPTEEEVVTEEVVPEEPVSEEPIEEPVVEPAESPADIQAGEEPEPSSEPTATTEPEPASVSVPETVPGGSEGGESGGTQE